MNNAMAKSALTSISMAVHALQLNLVDMSIIPSRNKTCASNTYAYQAQHLCLSGKGTVRKLTTRAGSFGRGVSECLGLYGCQHQKLGM